MSNTSSSKIGLLADVTGEYFTSRLISGGEAVAGGASGVNGARIGQVGSYLMVKQSTVQTLVMVERSYSVADRQGQAAHMARLTPLGELSSNGTFTRGVSRFPNIGDEVHLVAQEHLEHIFSAHGDVEYKVGHLASFDTIDVHLDASAFFGRHAAIL